MADVNVNYEDLISFKQTLGKNRQEFETIRTQLGSKLRGLTSAEWTDAVSQNFEGVFAESDSDIQNLEQTMQEFEAYLDNKIGILMRYHSNKL